jgi:hypothetical protein
MIGAAGQAERQGDIVTYVAIVTYSDVCRLLRIAAGEAFVLQQAYCSRRIAAGVLQQAYCSRRIAAGGRRDVLQQARPLALEVLDAVSGADAEQTL